MEQRNKTKNKNHTLWFNNIIIISYFIFNKKEFVILINYYLQSHPNNEILSTEINANGSIYDWYRIIIFLSTTAILTKFIFFVKKTDYAILAYITTLIFSILFLFMKQIMNYLFGG